jgi:hypothetical protein
MLGRWANQIQSSNGIDMTGGHFDRMIGRLQKEVDACRNRSERLRIDDHYDDAVDKNAVRPQPIATEDDEPKTQTLLYVETIDKAINSSIRQDDLEVYMRITTYRNKLFRLPEKLATTLRWIPYSDRFEIWQESRRELKKIKEKFEESRFKIQHPIGEKVKHRLIEEGVADEKLLQLIVDKFTSHLKCEKFVSRNQMLRNCYIMNHQKNPFLCTSNVELKLLLGPIAAEFDLSIEEIDRDDGH